MTMSGASTIILASASPRRRELLALIGFTQLEILPADIDETPLKGEAPLVYVARVAREKCAAIAALHPTRTVLAADTVVAMGRRILPKAEDAATARECLKLLSGRRHKVFTSVCVATPTGMKQKTSTSIVRFARLSAHDIDAYIASGEWEGKAGGYAIQGRAATFIAYLAGSHSGVMGLPLHEASRLLAS
jgi:septum formation protein